MDSRQIDAQFKETLQALEWDDGSGHKLYQSVDITPLSPEGIAPIRLWPCCLIVQTSNDVVGHRQTEVNYNYEITQVFSHLGDQSMERAIMGGNRGDGADGRGVYEAERIMLPAIYDLQESAGFSFSVIGQGTNNFNVVENELLIFRTQRLKVRGTSLPTYLIPTMLTHQLAGVLVGLSWVNPTQVGLSKIIVRRGATAPQTISSGSEVTLGSDLANSVVDSPGSGDHWYSVFAGYDEFENDGLVYSDPLSWKVTVP